MDKRQLRDALQQFHTELENADSISDSDREMLKHLEKDIQSLLERDVNPSLQEGASLIERLNQAIEQFEIDHPGLTLVIGHTLAILSQEGV